MDSAAYTVRSADLTRLTDALPALVLTGAGISVGAGIPTYRDRNGTWMRSAPIKHQEFVAEARARQRYWGRSLLGWPAVRDAIPSGAHRQLVQLEMLGAVTQLVTQNVDRLHQRAGSQRVTDLHGRIDRVICLSCGQHSDREALQSRLEQCNPQLRNSLFSLGTQRPDGDAELPDAIVADVTVPSCRACGGTLMPDVVFFGGSVPRERVIACEAALAQARSLLVIGSSLQVYSGYRFCRWAQRMGKPIFIINPGRTRADAMATRLSVEADAGLTALKFAVTSLSTSSPSTLIPDNP